LVGAQAPSPSGPEPYIAKVLGFFQEEDLDLTIIYSGAVDVYNLLALGRGDFAIGSADGLVRNVQNGQPLKAICPYLNRFTIELVVLAASPVKTVKDLQGKKIGVIGPGSFAIPYVSARFMEAGLAPDAHFVNIGEGIPMVLALTRKEVDAIAVAGAYLAWFDVEHIPVRRLESTLSKKLEGPVIVARTETITGEPMVVEGFLRAFAKARHYYLSNPRAGLIAMSKEVPEIGKDLERSIAMGTLTRANAALPKEAGGLYCWSSMGRWEALQDLMLAAGMVKKKLDPSAYFATQFILGANKFDRVKIKQAAQAVK